MSLTKVSYSMISGASANINDFGASTSLSDNSAAINAAIASLGADGGTVLIPAGVYKITSPVLVSSDYIHLVGQGASYLQTFGAIDGVQLGNGTGPDIFGNTYIGVSHGSISSLGILSGDGSSTRAILARGARDYSFTNVYTLGFGTNQGFTVAGVELKECWIHTWVGGEIKNGAGYGLYVNQIGATQSNSLRFYGLSVLNNVLYGIYDNGGSSRIYQVDCEGNTGGGMYLQNIAGFELTGGYFEGNTNAPDINVYSGCTGGYISGNYFNTATTSHTNIYLYSCDAVTVTNNFFFVSAASWIGTQVDATVTLYTNTVQNNSFTLSGAGSGNRLLGAGVVRLATQTSQVWTPVVYFTNTISDASYSTSGTYSLVNGVVTFFCNITFSNLGSVTGNLNIRGLPITSVAGFSPVCNLIIDNYNVGLTQAPLTVMDAGASIIRVLKRGATANAFLTNADMSATTSLIISGSYAIY